MQDSALAEQTAERETSADNTTSERESSPLTLPRSGKAEGAEAEDDGVATAVA